MIAELKSAQWIGEDGNMAVIAKTKLGAWRKIKKEMDEVGAETEDLALDKEWENCMSIAWAYLATDKDRQENEWEDAAEVRWYVSYKQSEIDGVKGVPVWALII